MRNENRQHCDVPPSRICGACRNRMNEDCVEECAKEKDYRYLELDPSRPLETLPNLTMDEYRELTGRAKGEWIFYIQGKILEVIGGENGRDTYYPTSRRLFANFKKQGVLAGADKPDTTPAGGTERKDTSERSGEVA